MPDRHEICPADDLPPGERMIVDVDGLSIGIFNIDGEYYGLSNVCPHQLANLCAGEIGGIVEAPAVGEYELKRDGEILRCPRHKWAFDIKTGESVFNPHKVRTRSFDVEVEPGEAETREQIEEYGTPLAGDEPPVDTYPVEVEEAVVVLYL